MPIKLTLEISDADLDHYREIMRGAARRAEKSPEKELAERARELLGKVRRSRAPDFVRERLAAVESLVGMLEDAEWGLEGEKRERVRTAVAYFADPLDLIPDSAPGLGFLDDAIMVELIVRDLGHEVDAYRDFVRFRERMEQRRGQEAHATRETWVAEKRRQMFLRMDRRREESEAGRRYRRQPLIISYRRGVMET